MPLDSALKRASAINVCSPWRAILPFPDGAISKPERQTVALQYSGILAAGLVAVPDVVGDAQAAGTAELQAAGFVVAVNTASSSSVPAGFIISQIPAGGAQALSGSTVTITVSIGDVLVPTGGVRTRLPYQLQVESDADKIARRAREFAQDHPKVRPDLDATFRESARISKAISEARAQIAQLRPQIEALEAQIAEERVKRTKAERAKLEKQLLLAQQKLTLISTQEAVLIEEMEVLDIAFIVLIALLAQT